MIFFLKWKCNFCCKRTTGWFFFFFCKETALHGKKSSWLLNMFQLDLSKIKEVQTDESLRGTGKMPVDVLAFVYTLRERKILSQRSSLTTERITTTIKPGVGEEGKDLICFTALTFSTVCTQLLFTEMDLLDLLQPQIHSVVKGAAREVSAIGQLHFLGLLSKILPFGNPSTVTTT